MRLTPRQTEILRLLASGLGDKQIAEALACSVHTVRFHIKSMMSAVNKRTRVGMVVRLLVGSQDFKNNPT